MWGWDARQWRCGTDESAVRRRQRATDPDKRVVHGEHAAAAAVGHAAAAAAAAAKGLLQRHLQVCRVCGHRRCAKVGRPDIKVVHAPREKATVVVAVIAVVKPVVGLLQQPQGGRHAGAVPRGHREGRGCR